MPHSDSCCLNFGCENPKVCDELGPCGSPIVGSPVSACDIVVDLAAFSYLRLQKGSLEPLANNHAAWLEAYRASLDRDYALLKPHLPDRPDFLRIIDVGSGLGGIDILLQRHYGGRADIWLLDGQDDPPVMTLHRRTFNDMAVADDFFKANGAVLTSAMSPDCLIDYDVFDLILSLGSWCFHYPPSVYLDFVKRISTAGSVLVIDVRKSKPEWAVQLVDAFGSARAIIHISDKIDRMVFVA